MGKREVSRHGHRTITAEVGLCDDRTLEPCSSEDAVMTFTRLLVDGPQRHDYTQALIPSTLTPLLTTRRDWHASEVKAAANLGRPW
jgi:hypothetical protein